MWDACTAKLIFGVLTSARDLDDICKVCPEVDEPVVSRSRGRDGHTSPRRMPSVTPDYLRELPGFHALLLYPGLRPVETEQRYWERRYAGLMRQTRAAMDASPAGEHPG
jgi:hypothetical protein